VSALTSCMQLLMPELYESDDPVGTGAVYVCISGRAHLRAAVPGIPLNPILVCSYQCLLSSCTSSNVLHGDYENSASSESAGVKISQRWPELDTRCTLSTEPLRTQTGLQVSEQRSRL
jgi:hypothetical protein